MEQAFGGKFSVEVAPPTAVALEVQPSRAEPEYDILWIARTGKGDGEVIEEALRQHLGLDLLDRLWARNDLAEDEAMSLAVEAQHATRRRKR